MTLQSRKSIRARAIGACLLAMAGWVAAAPATAADFYVNSVADKIDSTPGDGKCTTGSMIDGTTPECTLRAALDEVNALSKASPTKQYSIALQAGTYFLTTSELCTYFEPENPNVLTRTSTSFCITGNVTVTGDSAATSIIDGGGASRLFVIGSSATVAINRVTLQNAVDNGAYLDGGGAVVNNEGSLSLTSDVVAQNSAGVGGRVIINVGKLIVDNCVFEGNIGSPIASVTSAFLTDTSINASYFYNNTALQGAAVLVFDGARLRISNSTMTGNTVEENGIVFADNTPTTITNTTVSFNTIQNSGAVVAAGSTTMTLNNDTIYGNNASNTVGGFLGGGLIMSNTVIANNGLVDCVADPITDLGYNIIGNVTVNTVILCKTGSSTSIGVDPRLGPLRLYGGAVSTQNPLPDSPLIGKGSPLTPGSNAPGACTALDERGAVRGVSGRCSIGATEALTGLHVTAVLPNKGGVGGTVTATVNGSGFVAGSSLSLQRGSTVITAGEIEVSTDATAISATFSLAGAVPGVYDVVVQTPDGSTALTGAFTVQAVATPNVYMYITGESSGREGAPNFFTLVYGNTGNVDAYLTPVTLSLPGSFSSSFTQIVPPPVAAGQVLHDWKNVPVLVTPFSRSQSVNVPLIIPVIPAGSEGVLRFVETPPVGAPTTLTYDITASLGDPYGTGVGGTLSSTTLDELVAGATSYAQANLGVTLSASQIAKMSDYAAMQLASIVSAGERALLSSQAGNPVFYSTGQLTIDIATYGASTAVASAASVNARKTVRLAGSPSPKQPNDPCTGGVMKPGESCTPNPTVIPPDDPTKPDPNALPPSACLALPHHHISADGKQCVPDNPKGCPLIPNPLYTDPDCLRFKLKNSLDPNEKTGPLGLNDAHYLSSPKSLAYVIEFENSAKATGAAQKVVITDALDTSRFDLSTLQLGAISFGPYVITPPAGLTDYTTALDLRPQQNVIVSIHASLNRATGTLTWLFTSLDPGTMQATTDANAGFLPPDTAPPAGIGHVEFKVGLLPNVKDGQICNVGSIVFDTNAALVTAPFCNVRDTSAPVSHVASLPASTTTPTFVVSWSGTDAGAGIAEYSLFVSDNAGPFQLLTPTTTATSVPFTGQQGHQYGFYTIATDLMGNVEAGKKVAEATIAIGTASISVPNVVGAMQAAASAALTAANLTLGSVTSQASSLVAPGVVISESPAAGSMVAAKSAVSLVVSSGPAPVAVPNVLGLTEAAAGTAIVNAGLVVSSVTTQASATVTAGNVISEAPVAGTKVAPKSGVAIVVSSGLAPVKVPNVVGLAQAIASTAIFNAGLTVGTVTTQASTTVAAGLIISENPAAGNTVAPKSAVNVVVSSGPAPVIVPNIVGQTQAAASTALVNAGLTVGTVTTQASATVAAGLIISENPAAGTRLARNSAVALIVSSGPARVSVPNVVGQTQAAASTALVSSGLAVGTISMQTSASVAAGLVISESPAAGTLVAPNTAVTLAVSSGHLPADVNGDGIVSCLDLALVKAAFGSKAGQSAYSVNADVNRDGMINIVDLSTVAAALPAGTKCN